MTSFIKWLFSPHTIFIILLLLLWLYRYERKKREVIIIIIAITLFTIWISPFSYYTTKSWERKYPPFRIDKHKELLDNPNIHILVLGAGFTNDPDLPVTSKLDKVISLRLLEALRIYNLLDSAKIVTSGAAVKRSISQAEVVADAAVALGVCKQDTLYLANTLNTENEAESYLKRFGNTNKLILVTDALHMRRAVFWFNYYGLSVIPAPCNYNVKEDLEVQDFAWWPSYSKIKMLDSLMNEWLGLQWAYFKTKFLY